MNSRMEDLMYESGLTAQGCWDQMPEYDRAAIEKFAQLIVRACAQIGELKEQGHEDYDPDMSVGWYMRQHFGIPE